MNSKLFFPITTSAILIAILALAFFINQRETLLLDGKAHVSHLEHPVKVYFDQLAIPYIEARSEKDLTIAQGFVTASQRLFQMDILRRVAKGEMAAVFGNSSLPNDKLARIIGFKRIAEAEYPLLMPETKNWLKAYCQGVNAYISAGTLPLECVLLGYEPQAWQPEDTLAILKYLQYASDECWQLNLLQDEIAQKGGIALAKQLFGSSFKLSQLSASTEDTQEQLKNSSYSQIERQHFNDESEPTDSQKYDLHQPTLNHLGSANSLYNLVSLMPPAAELSWGSHACAISGAMSQSNKALLACDKDTLFNFPNLFFLSSLRAPFIHTVGITIPGVPGILIGRNDYFSWTAVNLKTRAQELRIETFSDKIVNQYTNKQGAFRAKELQEEIVSRFAPTRMEKIILTKDGPLLTKNGQIGIALNWYGCDPNNNIIDSILPLNKAKNWVEYNNALEKYKGSTQVFLYADTAGNIGKYIGAYNKHIGQILPITKGQDEESDTISDPAKFIIASEGQIYPLSSAESNLSLASSGITWSTLRAKQIIGSNQANKTKINLENMIALQSDVKAPLSELVTKTLKTAFITTKNIDKYENNAITMLNNWDGQLNANNPCASIYESFLTYFTKRILQSQISEQLASDYINKWPYWTRFTSDFLNKQDVNVLPATQHDFSIFSLDCLSQSLKNLRLLFKFSAVTDDLSTMQWRRLHRLDFCSNLVRFLPASLVNAFTPLLPKSISVDGDQDCLNSCNYQISNQSSLYMCNSGPTARILIDMADNDKFYHSLTFGQSGHFFSEDKISNVQLKSWRRLEFHPIAFSSKQLEGSARHILLLEDSLD